MIGGHCVVNRDRHDGLQVATTVIYTHVEMNQTALHFVPNY